MQKVTVRVPASTSNLGPGFDCLGIALRLYNNMTISRRPGSTICAVTLRSAEKVSCAMLAAANLDGAGTIITSAGNRGARLLSLRNSPSSILHSRSHHGSSR